jgi:hypothetical protein
MKNDSVDEYLREEIKFWAAQFHASHETWKIILQRIGAQGAENSEKDSCSAGEYKDRRLKDNYRYLDEE